MHFRLFLIVVCFSFVFVFFLFLLLFLFLFLFFFFACLLFCFFSSPKTIRTICLAGMKRKPFLDRNENCSVEARHFRGD